MSSKSNNKAPDIRWADGFRARGLRPRIAHAALEAIRRRNGGDLIPQHVVTAARKSGHPLHSFFDWDNKIAADQWRLDQARSLISAVVVVTESAGPSREYVHVVTGTKRRYLKTDDALRSDEDRGYILERAKADLRAFRERYQRFVACADLVAKVEEVLRAS